MGIIVCSALFATFDGSNSYSVKSDIVKNVSPWGLGPKLPSLGLGAFHRSPTVEIFSVEISSS